MTDLKTELAALKIDPEHRQGGGRGIVAITMALVALAIAAGAAWWVYAEPTVDVQAATVEAASSVTGAPAILNASGYVTARRRATVSSKMTGKVIEVNVEEGMRVRRGQVLARLDDSILRASLALAESQLAAARTNVEESEVRLKEAQLTLARRQQLKAEGVVGQADVDASQAEADSLRARIAAAREQAQVAARQVELQRTQLDDTIIRAPFDGVAISKDAQPGEMVSPVSAGGGFTRTGISTIVDMSSLEIEVDVSESYINRVTPGQTATAVLDAYPDWQIAAHVITTIPAADRQKATVLVRLGFEQLDPRILPDMGVKVAFHGAQEAPASGAPRSRTLLPRNAVRASGDNQVVFVITPDGRAERRAIRVGAEDGDRVEVLSGVSPAERVVVMPPADLADGTKVRVKEPS
jgi:RND family efflux transporter MFP subunit